MEGKEQLIISAINELKEEQKETRKEISTMNKAVASLASYHQRLNNLEESVRDLPKIKIIVNGIVWVVAALAGGFLISISKAVNVTVCIARLSILSLAKSEHLSRFLINCWERAKYIFHVLFSSFTIEKISYVVTKPGNVLKHEGFCILWQVYDNLIENYFSCRPCASFVVIRQIN